MRKLDVSELRQGHELVARNNEMLRLIYHYWYHTGENMAAGMKMNRKRGEVW